MSDDENIFNNLAEKAEQHLEAEKAAENSAGQQTGTDLGIGSLPQGPQREAGKKLESRKKPEGPNT